MDIKNYYFKFIDIIVGILFGILFLAFLGYSISVYSSALDFHHELINDVKIYAILKEYFRFELITLLASIMLIILEFIVLKVFTKSKTKNANNDPSSIELYQMEYFSNKRKLGLYATLFVFFYLTMFFLIISLDSFLGIGKIIYFILILTMILKTVTIFSLWKIGYSFFYMILFRNLIRYS